MRTLRAHTALAFLAGVTLHRLKQTVPSLRARNVASPWKPSEINPLTKPGWNVCQRNLFVSARDPCIRAFQIGLERRKHAAPELTQLGTDGGQDIVDALQVKVRNALFQVPVLLPQHLLVVFPNRLVVRAELGTQMISLGAAQRLPAFDQLQVVGREHHRRQKPP